MWGNIIKKQIIIGGIRMILCCKEHVELALDEIVDEYEVAPIIRELSEEEKLSTICGYCKEKAVYIVEN